jgi:Protein of unknown function (DUF3037)
VSYRYSIVKFVPDAARGEAVNLGVLAGDDDSGDWDLRLTDNYRRARAIDVPNHLPAALSFLARLQDHVDASGDPDAFPVEPMTTELLERFSYEMRNVVQFTPPAPVAAPTAEDALDTLFGQLVVDVAARKFPWARKHAAVGTTRRAYKQQEIPQDRIAERVTVSAGPYEGAFDFAVHNGEAVQLVQCWSFQLPGQIELADQVKAWAWVARSLREHGGGEVRKGDAAFRADDQVNLATVYLPPLEDQPSHAFEEAQAAFAEIPNLLAVTPDSAESVARIAAQCLSSHA